MAQGMKAPAFVKLPELVANYSKQPLIMHELGKALDKEKGKG